MLYQTQTKFCITGCVGHKAERFLIPGQAVQKYLLGPIARTAVLPYQAIARTPCCFAPYLELRHDDSSKHCTLQSLASVTIMVTQLHHDGVIGTGYRWVRMYTLNSVRSLTN
jgi:hypothetical protein